MKKIEKIKLWLQKLSLMGIIALIILSILIPLKFTDAEYGIWVNLSSNIGIAIFSALSISRYLQKETQELILDEIPMLQKANKAGIEDLILDISENSIDILNDYTESKRFFIVMNDGKTFISNNASKLQSRFSKDGFTTTFIFLDFESDAPNFLCDANDKKDKSTYKNKIKQNIEDIENHYIKKYPNHNFEIYLYGKSFFRTSIILTDALALIGTYRNAPGKIYFPLHFLLSKNGEKFEGIVEDVESIRGLSKKWHGEASVG